MTRQSPTERRREAVEDALDASIELIDELFEEDPDLDRAADAAEATLGATRRARSADKLSQAGGRDGS